MTVRLPPGRIPLNRRLHVLGIGNARSVIFLRWAWRVRELGHRVSVVSDRFSTNPAELDGLELYDIRRLGRLNGVRGLRRLRFGPTIRHLVRDAEVDVIHGHYLLPYGFWAALGASAPLVVSPWGTDVLIDGQRPGRDRFRARTALAAADAVVVNSAASKRAAIALGAAPDHIETIVWYADLGRYGPDRRDEDFRRRLGWPDDALIAISLRNFRPDTNIDIVVEAFSQVARSEPRARLLLAATGGPLKSDIEQLVDRLALREKVVFCTADESELPGLVASADVLVSMTKSDSTPASLLEAMASALPVVCAEAPSIDEWIAGGDGGEIVPQRDRSALAGSLARLFADTDRRQAYGERNRRVVRERLPASGPGPALERLYLDLVGRGRAPSKAAVSRRRVEEAISALEERLAISGSRR